MLLAHAFSKGKQSTIVKLCVSRRILLLFHLFFRVLFSLIATHTCVSLPTTSLAIPPPLKFPFFIIMTVSRFLRVGSYNASSLNAATSPMHSSNKTRILISNIPAFPIHEIDILMLQETGKIHSPEIFLSPYLSLAIHSIDQHNTYASIALYYNRATFDVLNNHVIHLGRCTATTFLNKKLDYKLLSLNIYGFASGSFSEFDNLFKKIQLFIDESKKTHGSSLEILIGGDFNIHLPDTSPKASLLRDFCNALNLFEPTLNLTETWRGNGERSHLSSKLDHIFSSFIFWDKIEKIPSPLSDHALICSTKSATETKIPEPPPFILKNTKILRRKDLSKKIAKIIAEKIFAEEIIGNNHIPQPRMADLTDNTVSDFAQKIDEVIVAYSELNPMLIFNRLSKHLSEAIEEELKNEQKIYRQIRNRFNRIEARISRTQKTKEQRSELRLLFQEQLNIRSKQAEDRQRLRQLQSQMHSLRSFFRRSKLSTKHEIRVIRDPEDGSLTYDPDRILKIFRDGFKEKCTDPTFSPEDGPCMHDRELETIARKYGIDLGQRFPPQEPIPDGLHIDAGILRKSFNQLKNICAPGASGLDKNSLLFLLNFFPNSTVSAFNFLAKNPDWEKSSHTKYLKIRRLVFIPKKGKDLTQAKNYRPISLLETPYKIIAKLYADMILPGVEQVVSPNQFGFVPGRVMSNASLTLIATIEKLKKSLPDTFLWFCDIQSAFDKAKIKTITHLTKLLYPTSQIPELMARFNHNCCASISINGISSDLLTLSIGTGQGDPSSTIRYLLIHTVWEHIYHTQLSKPPLHSLSIPTSAISHPDNVKETSNSTIVESTMFADDTATPLQLPSDDETIDHLLILLEDLHTATGLKINTEKSEILIIRNSSFLNSHTTRLLNRLGKISTQVKHLGIYLSRDYETGLVATYTEGLESMKRATKKILPIVGNSDLFVKKNATNMVVSSIMNHRLRVYFPSDKTLDKIWKSTRAALWSSQYSDSAPATRHRINKQNVIRPPTAGGLRLISPFQSSVSAALSSILSLYDFTNFNPTSTLNKIENLRSHKQHSLMVLNASTITKIIRSAPNAFPHPNPQFIDRLSSTLSQLERDRYILWNAPTYRHSMLPDRNLYFKKIQDEELRLYGQQFPTIASLCKRQKDGCYDLNSNSDELQQLSNRNKSEFDKLSNLRSIISQKLPTTAKNPTRPKFPNETWATRAINTSTGFLKKALRRVFQLTLYEDHITYIPPSYHTRNRDGIDIPANPAQFRQAYLPLRIKNLPSKLHSFHLEFLNRTLVSRTKLMKWDVDDAPNITCTHCHCPLSSSHSINRCILPTMCRSFLKQLFREQNLPDIFSQDCFLDYLWDPQINDASDPHKFNTLFTAITAIKLHAHRITRNPRFDDFNPYKFVAQSVIAVREGIEAARKVQPPDLPNSPLIEALLELLERWQVDDWLREHQRALDTTTEREEYFSLS